MRFSEIVSSLAGEFGEEILVAADEAAVQPYIEVPAGEIASVCRFLFETPELFFDFLACMTGVDNGPEKGTMEVIYHMNSIPLGHSLVIKVTVERLPGPDELPKVPTVSDIWRTADWHEREIYDLFGIGFEGHPDMRRILMPADWEGFPLRKDYREQLYYHGIKVAYEDREDPGLESGLPGS